MGPYINTKDEKRFWGPDHHHGAVKRLTPEEIEAIEEEVIPVKEIVQRGSKEFTPWWLNAGKTGKNG